MSEPLQIVERSWDAIGGHEPPSGRALQDAIDEYNVVVTGRRDWFGLVLELRDANGALHGGVRAVAWAGWLHVLVLYVDEPLRRHGWGSRLLARAEALAAARGCRDVFLDTFSFQGEHFYPRHGYRVFGRLDDWPEGHAHVFLHKRLAPAESPAARHDSVS